MTADAATSATREEIIAHLNAIMDEYKPSEISATVEILRRAFDEKTKEYREGIHERFVAEGGEEKDFAPVPDVLEQQMKERLEVYRQRREAQQKEIDKEQEQNALVKRNVINNLQTIIEGEGVENHYKEVRDLQDTWKNTGSVPRAEAGEINGAYKKLLDEYYAKMKVARELRELDMKRNLEAKIALCERAEELSTSKMVVKAFHELRTMQNRWKTIGHVPQEQREPLWTRFRAAADVIFANYREYEAASKDREEENYKAKLALCEEIEALTATPVTTRKESEAAVKKIDELMQRWRKIGFAPKAVNDEVYARFRRGCNKVYEARRAIVKDITADYKANLEKKVALCEKAEELAQSTDWSRTTTALVALQKQWKTIGPVAHKDSDAVWTRFRAACDAFFNAKEKHFDGDDQMRDNLTAKKALIEELKSTTMPEDVDEHFKVLQDFQRRWNEIGFVPMKDKKAVNAEFSNLLNEQYDRLNTDDATRNLQRFKSRMELMADREDAESGLISEQRRLVKRIAQAEADIAQLKNNVGFFAHSAKADSLVADVNRKIQTAEQNLEVLQQKLDILNKMLE